MARLMSQIKGGNYAAAAGGRRRRAATAQTAAAGRVSPHRPFMLLTT
jgi:hypothetical protein